jgi:hypothetical protein
VASEGDCRRRADANEALSIRLASEGEFGWATTTAFYAAVHLVNVLLIRAAKYRDDTDHKTRQIFLRDNHAAIEARYDTMLSRSMRTRYEPWFTADDRYYRGQAKLLADVRDYVDRFLAGKISSIPRSGR